MSRRRRRILQRPAAPVPERGDRRPRTGPPGRQPLRRRQAGDLPPGPVDRADQVQRLAGRLLVAFPQFPEVAAGMCPARLVGDRAAAGREVGPVGSVAVGHKGSAAGTGEPRRVAVPAGVREREHDLAPVAGHRPEVALPHAPRLSRMPTGPDRRFVHLDDGAPGTDRHWASWTGPGSGMARLAHRLREPRLTVMPVSASIRCRR